MYTIMKSFLAPEGVSVPFVVMATDTTLLLSWNSPAKPNGNITGYFLYRDAVEVYRGIERKHINDGLRVCRIGLTFVH